MISSRKVFIEHSSECEECIKAYWSCVINGKMYGDWCTFVGDNISCDVVISECHYLMDMLEEDIEDMEENRWVSS